MAQATSKACSVPGCCCYSQKQPYLSFHSFPVDGEGRRRWVQAIRREEGPDFTIKTGSTYVCSRHFTLDDYVLGMNSPFSITIRRLRPDAVPSLSCWHEGGGTR
uniref:THAP-type domain-containing protein n=1 Tax=Sander lucioperca TaxID=283035 RepID=A0A8C9ZPD3_SANLU